MNKYLPLLIASFVTMAFVAVKKSVITALPGINKMINTCPSESDIYINRQLKRGDWQVKENYLKRDSLTSFLFISKYTFQNNKKQNHQQNKYFSYGGFVRTELQYSKDPSCSK